METSRDNRMCKLIEGESSNLSYDNRRFKTIYANDSNIDTRDLNATKWLNTISAKAYADYEEEQRALRKLSKIVTKARIESGYFVVSMFFNISVIREKTATKVIDEKEMDDFTSNPYDIDYEISPDDILSAMDSEPTWKVCAAVTHDANPACPECNGEGVSRCDKCGGSGRELYVAGNFANGLEQMKEGACPRCYGTGKIQCGKCAGSGKRQLFSKQVQTLKTFKDIKKEMSRINTFTTFGSYSMLCCLINDEEGMWDRFNNEELKDGITKLHKTQKEILIDKNPVLPDIIKEYKDLEKDIDEYRKEAFAEFKKNKQGKSGCIIEKHLVVPIFRLWYSTKIDQKERYIEIYETTDKEIYYDFSDRLPKLSFWKSLFI